MGIYVGIYIYTWAHVVFYSLLRTPDMSLSQTSPGGECGASEGDSSHHQRQQAAAGVRTVDFLSRCHW